MDLEQAKAVLMEQRWKGGSECPCCGQFAKVYKRLFNKTMARGLLWLAQYSKSTNETWIETQEHAPRWLVNKGGTLATMAHWGLIEQDEVRPHEDKRASGRWRLTEKGERFVNGQVAIPKHVYLYNGEIVSFSDEMFLIQEAIDPFSYSELMGPAT